MFSISVKIIIKRYEDFVETEIFHFNEIECIKPNELFAFTKKSLTDHVTFTLNSYIQYLLLVYLKLYISIELSS